MGDGTQITWADATWNPTLGCSKVSEGCDTCYAIRSSARHVYNADYEGVLTEDRRDWSGQVNLVPARLDQPLHWKKPRRIFVDSMSDLFHPRVPAEFVGRVFNAMATASWHQFQVLTKRPQRMRSLLGGSVLDANGVPVPTDVGWELRPWPLPNVWLGSSIESDRYAFRADHVRATPAAVRFLSLEPLLGPLPSLDLAGIDWIIVGAESGPGARPMEEDWVRELRDRATAGGVAFFYKQAIGPDGRKVHDPQLDGRSWTEYPDESR